MSQCGYAKRDTLYKGDGLLLNIYACYPWEMTLKAGLDVSFDNMQNWKEIRGKVGEVNSTKAYVTGVQTSR
jgi:hypothetical protein